MRQEGNTKNMIFSFDKIISYVSQFVTLKIGDLIFTGTPAGVSKINVNTECQLTFTAAVRTYFEADKDLVGKGYDPRKVLNPGYEAIIATVSEKMELFGSVNKA